METYLVKFWLKNNAGFIEQKSEIVEAEGKNSHKLAEEFIIEKHKIEVKDIIGVYYQ